MSKPTRKKGGGGKLSRSETVTVRLDPKLRYLAGLAARKQRRTLSSYIEWVIEESLDRVCIEGTNQNDNRSIAEEALTLWDVDESDRFVKLALNHPDLLAHDEQVLWKLIQENGYLWCWHDDPSEEWIWTAGHESIIFDRLRDHWQTFKAVAAGDKDKDDLPTWTTKKAVEDEKPDDDEVPF